MTSLRFGPYLRYRDSPYWLGCIAATSAAPWISAPIVEIYYSPRLSVLLCYYLGALANFYALTIIAASVERPLLFAYPIFVVLITTVLHRRAPSAPVVLALLLTTAGVVLVTGAF